MKLLVFMIQGKKNCIVQQKNALVVMAWKQPLGFFFVNSTCSAIPLKEILTKCIEKTNSINLDIRGIKSDMGSNFIQLSRIFGINKNNPTFDINGKKIYYMFDPPYLIKGIRNVLINYIIDFEGQLNHGRQFLCKRG